MTPQDRFSKLSTDFKLPWQMVCQYVAGKWYPKYILDANGDKVMDCAWGAGTERGTHMYACIMEAVGDRVKYGNPY